MLVRFATAKLSTFWDIHNICTKNLLKNLLTNFGRALEQGLPALKGKASGHSPYIGAATAENARFTQKSRGFVQEARLRIDNALPGA